MHRSREVIDIPAAPVQVAEHRFLTRTCPVCRQRRTPQAGLTGVALGKQRLGLNLLSLIVALREAGRLPFRTIQWRLKTVRQLSLVWAPIARTVHQAAQRGEPGAAEVLERIR